MGADVTEFRCSFGKAYLAPVYDFASKEIVAHSVSRHPDMAQQREMLGMPVAAKPEGATPVLHSDMGWQYRHGDHVSRLRDNGFVQSMSRKGNCPDNAATEQVFGHLKDEFFRGRDRDDFDVFKTDLEAYIRHWNHTGRQAAPNGLTPVEFRDRNPCGTDRQLELPNPKNGAQFNILSACCCETRLEPYGSIGSHYLGVHNPTRGIPRVPKTNLKVVRTRLGHQPLSSTSSNAPITVSGMCDWKKSRSFFCSRSNARRPDSAPAPNR